MKKIFKGICVACTLTCLLAMSGCSTGTSPSAADPVSTVETPTFSKSSGTYYWMQFVTINSKTSDATIYYTTDGTDPTTASAVFSDYIFVDSSLTVKAMAVKSGLSNSAVSTVTYVRKCRTTGSTTAGLPYYAIDGTKTMLPLPTGATGGTITTSGETSDGTFCTIGYTYSDVASPRIPCYWKNDTYNAMKLPSTAIGGCPQYSTCIVGTDIYVTGYTYDSAKVEKPCYWKNGSYMTISLPSGATDGGTGESMTVSGDDVYVPGYVTISSNKIPGYWTNGTFTRLTTPDATYGNTEHILISGSNIYVSGEVSNSSSKCVPCLWSNGSYAALESTASGDYSTGYRAGAIFVFGSDIYVGGYAWTNSGSWMMRPLYWKNGKLITLSLPSSDKSGGIWDIFQPGSSILATGSWTSSTQTANFYFAGTTYHSGTIFSL